MTQFSGLWFSGSLRTWLEASSSIALRARAVSREVSQSIAAQERVEARIGRRCADIGRSKSQDTPRTVVPYTKGRRRPARPGPHKFCITATPRRPAPSARWCPGSNRLTPKKTGCVSDNKSSKWSLHATLVQACFQQALANQSLNRTFCGVRPLGFISFSPNSRTPQNAG